MAQFFQKQGYTGRCEFQYGSFYMHFCGSKVLDMRKSVFDVNMGLFILFMHTHCSKTTKWPVIQKIVRRFVGQYGSFYIIHAHTWFKNHKVAHFQFKGYAGRFRCEYGSFYITHAHTMLKKHKVALSLNDGKGVL